MKHTMMAFPETNIVTAIRSYLQLKPVVNLLPLLRSTCEKGGKTFYISNIGISRVGYETEKEHYIFDHISL